MVCGGSFLMTPVRCQPKTTGATCATVEVLRLQRYMSTRIALSSSTRTRLPTSAALLSRTTASRSGDGPLGRRCSTISVCVQPAVLRVAFSQENLTSAGKTLVVTFDDIG